MADAKFERDQLITFGFIRECQKLLPSGNIYYIIPIEIYGIFYDYYHFQITFHQHLDYPKNAITIIDDTLAKKSMEDYSYAHCFINEEISANACKQFNVTIKWVNMVLDFFAGYITIDPKEYLKKYGNNAILATTDDAECAECVWIHSTVDTLDVYNKDNPGGLTTDKVADTDFDEGDVFIFSFDFEKDQWRINHNGKDIYTLSLKGCKKLTPTFSMYEENEQIAISNYEYVY